MTSHPLTIAHLYINSFVCNHWRNLLSEAMHNCERTHGKYLPTALRPKLRCCVRVIHRVRFFEKQSSEQPDRRANAFHRMDNAPFESFRYERWNDLSLTDLPLTRACTWTLSAISRTMSDSASDIPELLVLHIRHIVIVSVLKRFRDSALVSLLVLTGAYEAVEERENYTHRGGDHLVPQSALFRIGLDEDNDTYSHDPAGRIQRFLFLEEDERADEVT